MMTISKRKTAMMDTYCKPYIIFSECICPIERIWIYAFHFFVIWAKLINLVEIAKFYCSFLK